MAWVVMLVLFILFVFSFPAWPYNRAWGYYPSLLIALLWIILFVMLSLGIWRR